MPFIYPAATMVFYIFVIGIFTFRARFKGVKSGEVQLGYFKVYDDAKYKISEPVMRISRHYNNMFELPLLYLLTCVALAQSGVAHPVAKWAAWGFVVSRMGHSYYHLGSNHVGKRAIWFFLGWACVLVMWVMLLVVGL